MRVAAPALLAPPAPSRGCVGDLSCSLTCRLQDVEVVFILFVDLNEKSSNIVTCIIINLLQFDMSCTSFPSGHCILQRRADDDHLKIREYESAPFLVNEYDQFDMTGALRTSRDGTMVPCAAMRFALAHPRRFEDQPGLPRRLCVFWGFLIEGPLLIERFVRNPYAKAQYDCGCPVLFFKEMRLDASSFQCPSEVVQKRVWRK